jgi:hypothetical protein
MDWMSGNIGEYVAQPCQFNNVAAPAKKMRIRKARTRKQG